MPTLATIVGYPMDTVVILSSLVYSVFVIPAFKYIQRGDISTVTRKVWEVIT